MTDEPETVEQAISRSLGSLIVQPASDLADLLSDQIRYIRWRSLVQIATRAREFREARGISENTIPIKFLIPLLEEGSKEDEDSGMIDIWAQLLASADKKVNSFDLMCIDILKKITHSEASIIQATGKNVLDGCPAISALNFMNITCDMEEKEIQRWSREPRRSGPSVRDSTFLREKIKSLFIQMEEKYPGVFISFEGAQLKIENNNMQAESLLALQVLDILRVESQTVLLVVDKYRKCTFFTDKSIPPRGSEVLFRGFTGILKFHAFTQVGSMLWARLHGLDSK